ncbi:MAG: helix-turn-helix domain-containing protein [Acidimicrobiales bacterium]
MQSEHRFVVAARPVIEALGAEVVILDAGGAQEPLDIPLVWEGKVVGLARPHDLHGALDRLLERVAEELGAPLAELSREGKQRAVQLLEERGAFNLRKSVEDAAQALQVSRFTVYNYLSRMGAAKAEPTSSRPPKR